MIWRFCISDTTEKRNETTDHHGRPAECQVAVSTTYKVVEVQTTRGVIDEKIVAWKWMTLYL